MFKVEAVIQAKLLKHKPGGKLFQLPAGFKYLFSDEFSHRKAEESLPRFMRLVQ